MSDTPVVVAFRRLGDRHGLDRLLRGRRSYEVVLADGTRRRVSFGTLDSVLDARRNPADFWACVHAADEAFDRAGPQEHVPVVAWPRGQDHL